MKKLLLIIIVNCTFLIVNCFSQQYGWTDISANIPGTPDLSDVFFVSDSEGWISVSSGPEIYHTSDGGETFEIQETSFGTSTAAIYMIDENEGYTGGGSGFVYRTIDGGLNWNFHGAISSSLNNMDFATSTQGYCCGDNGWVFSITPQGVTNLNSGLSTYLYGISSPSENKVWVCGGSTISHFNGSTFEFQSGPAGTYNAIYFINDNEGWVAGNAGLIGHTENGGNTWLSQTNPDPDKHSLYDLFFLNENKGWAVGFLGTIIHTIDGGETWELQAQGLTTNFLTGVHFTSPTNGYVVGNEKTLLKYTQITSVEDEKVQPSEYRLEQNYPNPFNPTTTIKYSVPKLSFVTIKIYDVLGSEVAALVNEEKPAGEYEVEFNPNRHSRESGNLSSGVYFYQLKAGEFIQTKKMILMK